MDAVMYRRTQHKDNSIVISPFNRDMRLDKVRSVSYLYLFRLAMLADTCTATAAVGAMFKVAHLSGCLIRHGRHWKDSSIRISRS